MFHFTAVIRFLKPRMRKQALFISKARTTKNKISNMYNYLTLKVSNFKNLK